jgi:hypothetical protein
LVVLNFGFLQGRFQLRDRHGRGGFRRHIFLRVCACAWVCVCVDVECGVWMRWESERRRGEWGRVQKSEKREENLAPSHTHVTSPVCVGPPLSVSLQPCVCAGQSPLAPVRPYARVTLRLGTHAGREGNLTPTLLNCPSPPPLPPTLFFSHPPFTHTGRTLYLSQQLGPSTHHGPRPDQGRRVEEHGGKRETEETERKARRTRLNQASPQLFPSILTHAPVSLPPPYPLSLFRMRS